MGTKRKPNATIVKADGTEINLTGDAAQSAIRDYERHYHGEIGNSLLYTDDDENKHYVEFKCICEFIVLPPTEETIPDRPCDQLDCIADYPPVTTP